MLGLDESLPQRPASMHDRILALKALPSLAGAEHEAITWMAEHSRQRFFSKGTVLHREGEPIHTVHLVIRGSVRRVRKGDASVIGRGQGVGFLSTLARDEHGFHSEALEDTLTFEIPVEVVLHAYEANFAFTKTALRNMARVLLDARGNLPIREGVLPSIEEGVLRKRPLTLVERVFHMKDSGIFQGKSLDAIFEIARHQREISFEKGEYVWRIGDPSTSILRTEYGQFECTGPDGRKVTIGTQFILGAMDLFSGDARRFSVRALTLAQGISTPRDPFLSMLEAHPDVAADLAATLARSVLDRT